jgi:hypothetical protein
MTRQVTMLISKKFQQIAQKKLINTRFVAACSFFTR